MGTRKILPWVAATSTLLVALHPGTAWLVQLPVRGIAVALTGGLEANRQRVAAQKPQNATLALAAAGNDLNRVQSLVSRFPGSPDIRAVAVRLATVEGRGIRLPKPDKAGTAEPGKFYASGAQALIDNAVAGAKLDPDNAFFPAMKAVALLTQRQDTAAWDSLREAARKSHYNDYTAASLRGKLQLTEQAQGRTPITPAIALIAAELYPHYAPLRNMTFWAQERAIALEKTGHTEEGMAMRQDILNLGHLMRRDSTTIIGSLVGEALCAIATNRPNGIRVPEIKEFLKTGASEETAREQRDAQIAENWKAWAVKAGHPELAEVATENQQQFAQAKVQRGRVIEDSFVSVNTVVSEALLLFLVAWLFYSFVMTIVGTLRKNGASVALPIHPMRLVASAMVIETIGVALTLLASSKSSLNLGWAAISFLVLGMMFPDIHMAVIARRTGVLYKKLAPTVRRSVYPVLASLLLILWAALMLGVGKQENQWRTRLDAYITQENAPNTPDV
ncbi:MAG: hypothetical protein QM758_02340 [Armatimonas sp.]